MSGTHVVNVKSDQKEQARQGRDGQTGEPGAQRLSYKTNTDWCAIFA